MSLDLTISKNEKQVDMMIKEYCMCWSKPNKLLAYARCSLKKFCKISKWQHMESLAQCMGFRKYVQWSFLFDLFDLIYTVKYRWVLSVKSLGIWEAFFFLTFFSSQKKSCWEVGRWSERVVGSVGQLNGMHWQPSPSRSSSKFHLIPPIFLHMLESGVCMNWTELPHNPANPSK